VLFNDTFTEPNGQPQGWAVNRSAADPSSGAFIDSDRMRFTVALTSSQVGTVQYVQAHETGVQPSWAAGTVLFDWQMSSSLASTQTESLILLPSAISTNSAAASNLLRVRVVGGTLSVVTRINGADATLWYGPITADNALHDFELRIDATNLSIYEGTAGNAVLRAGPIAHHLSWTAGWPYLHASTDSATPWTPYFDNVSIRLRSS
jgi:hypothetical protein